MNGERSATHDADRAPTALAGPAHAARVPTLPSTVVGTKSVLPSTHCIAVYSHCNMSSCTHTHDPVRAWIEDTRKAFASIAHFSLHVRHPLSSPLVPSVLPSVRSSYACSPSTCAVRCLYTCQVSYPTRDARWHALPTSRRNSSFEAMPHRASVTVTAEPPGPCHAWLA